MGHELGLKGKRAMVCAASRGLGRATALALAQEGCRVAICSRSLDRAEAAARDIERQTGEHVWATACDLSLPGEADRMADYVRQNLGGVDILINNTGGPKPGTFDSLSEENFRQAADQLLFSVVRTTKAFLPLMRQDKRGGRIITITSVAVKEVIANLMLSNSLRAAVTNWSKTLARELAPERILVNCVAPGTIATERIEELIAANSKASGKPAADVRSAMLARIPMGRFGEPEEFARAIVFLASDWASYISGTTLVVDGAAMAGVT